MGMAAVRLLFGTQAKHATQQKRNRSIYLHINLDKHAYMSIASKGFSRVEHGPYPCRYLGQFIYDPDLSGTRPLGGGSGVPSQ